MGNEWATESNEKRFRRGLVFKARRLFVSLISRPRVIKKKKRVLSDGGSRQLAGWDWLTGCGLGVGSEELGGRS